MKKYTIKYKNNEIAVYEYKNNRLEAIKKMGEEFNFYNNYDEFWNWWKSKTNYEKGEKVFFKVQSDNSDFQSDFQIDKSITVCREPDTPQEKIIEKFSNYQSEKNSNKETSGSIIEKLTPIFSFLFVGLKHIVVFFREIITELFNGLKNMFGFFMDKLTLKKEKKELKKKASTIKSKRRL